MFQPGRKRTCRVTSDGVRGRPGAQGGPVGRVPPWIPRAESCWVSTLKHFMETQKSRETRTRRLGHMMMARESADRMQAAEGLPTPPPHDEDGEAAQKVR